MFSTIFYEQPLLHTTVIDTRHDGARSQVIDTKPLTSGFNMPIYGCGLKPDEFRRASVNIKLLTRVWPALTRVPKLSVQKL